MAVHFRTPRPRRLLEAFRNAIAEGEIQTWAEDERRGFTHSARQWLGKAYFLPVIYPDGLVFGLHPSTDTVTKTVYGVYHGRLIEAFLTHFDARFSVAEATAQPTDDDGL